MKTILIVLISLLSVTASAQTSNSSSHELIPFYFEKSGVQITVNFRHSLIYASTKNLMVNYEADVQANPYLSFNFLPADKYFTCAAKQLEILGETLKSPSAQGLKTKFPSILLTVMISPTATAASFCPSVLRSSEKKLTLSICLDESKSADTGCSILTATEIAEHYTKAQDMKKARDGAEARMRNAAERLLQWIQP